MANGHTYPQVDHYDWGSTWAQRPLLFRNLKGKRFEEIPPATGSGLALTLPARGAAFGDLFNEGRISVVLNNLDAAPTLLRNVTHNKNNWLTLRLVGGPRSPRDAIGAVVFLTAGGMRQRGDVLSGGSYCSQSDLRVHFGLGSATQVDKLEIRWPSGQREIVHVPYVNRILTIEEGNALLDKKRGQCRVPLNSLQAPRALVGDVYSCSPLMTDCGPACGTAVQSGLRSQVHGSAAGALECGCEAAALPCYCQELAVTGH